MAASYRTYGDPHAADPPTHAAVVSPNDSTDLAFATTWVYVGSGGSMQVTMAGGEQVTFAGMLSGTAYPLRVSRIWSTGTSASNIMALWREE